MLFFILLSRLIILQILADVQQTSEVTKVVAFSIYTAAA